MCLLLMLKRCVVLFAAGPKIEFQSFFEPITMWMHNEPEQLYDFIELVTRMGTVMHLSAKHLIYRSKCQGYGLIIIRNTII